MVNYKSLFFKTLLIGTTLLSCFVNAAIDLETKNAAERGDPEAQFHLGLAFALGQVVTKDTVQAYTWLSIAAARGIELSKEARDDFAQFMSRSQMKKAENLTREYLEAYGPGWENPEGN